MRHKAADEVHVAAEAVQLGHGDIALEPLGSSQGGFELRSAVERIRALACLYLNELADQLKTLGLGKLLERPPLSFDAKA